MLRHIVLLSFKPEATAEDRAAVRAAVEGFRDQVPELRALVCGDNIGSSPNHHDFAVVADFDDMEAFRRYIASPAHKAYVEGPAKAVAKIAAIQHEF
ncbi:Dabb family protein [Tropicimonas sp. IMCC34043]|uniref:Dabb family protein n=1 Tax=Tropicimonas sp. IMCC34043 TaxID=2248760 RepID=UPI001300788A|nr:Dabb family protein [Tropicimonas sp. IMCC34043]